MARCSSIELYIVFAGVIWNGISGFGGCGFKLFEGLGLLSVWGCSGPGFFRPWNRLGLRGACFVSWGFPKIRGTILGVPILRTIVYWGLYWGPPFLGKNNLGLLRIWCSDRVLVVLLGH